MSSAAVSAALPMASEVNTGKPPARKLTAVPSGTTDPYAAREKQHNEGHGRRLTAAFEALEAFPALAESRKRVLRLVSQEQPSVSEMVDAIESDVALVISVMRLANKRPEARGRIRTVPQAIEDHHADGVTGEAALVRLADMLAHYAQGQAVAPDQLLAVARRVGLGPQDLREVLFDLPGPPPDRKRSITPCPLSGRELEVLKRLAEGKVYKQIALELGLSTSTVRTHLHNVYGKLGAVDRAQAVLIASERGWL